MRAVSDNEGKMFEVCNRMALVEHALASQKPLPSFGDMPLDVETALKMFRHIARQALGLVRPQA